MAGQMNFPKGRSQEKDVAGNPGVSKNNYRYIRLSVVKEGSLLSVNFH